MFCHWFFWQFNAVRICEKDILEYNDFTYQVYWWIRNKEFGLFQKLQERKIDRKSEYRRNKSPIFYLF